MSSRNSRNDRESRDQRRRRSPTPYRRPTKMKNETRTKPTSLRTMIERINDSLRRLENQASRREIQLEQVKTLQNKNGSCQAKIYEITRRLEAEIHENNRVSNEQTRQMRVQQEREANIDDIMRHTNEVIPTNDTYMTVETTETSL